ncbi:hypothetical protein V2I01_17775 [Micromonospora sp. BRA006-A]|nr:hypothetical protein [Micromonospora sp. BRA006-A]
MAPTLIIGAADLPTAALRGIGAALLGSAAIRDRANRPTAWLAASGLASIPC